MTKYTEIGAYCIVKSYRKQRWLNIHSIHAYIKFYKLWQLNCSVNGTVLVCKLFLATNHLWCQDSLLSKLAAEAKRKIYFAKQIMY